MSNSDIRTKQRLNNFSKVLIELDEITSRYAELNKFELQGLIKCFEYCYELSWNVLKDYFEDQGFTGLTGSRDVYRLAFKQGVISNGEVWMEMIGSRAKTVHTYDKETSLEVCEAVVTRYHPLFKDLLAYFLQISK